MLCITLRGLGVEVDAALREAGMSGWTELSTSEAQLDQATITRLVVVAIEATSRPWLGLDVGFAVQTSSHGSLGHAVLASRNLAQALETVARYGNVRYRSIQFQCLEQTNGQVLFMHELLDLGESRTFVACMVFVTLLRMMEGVVGHRLLRVTVEFPFPEPDWRVEIDRFCTGPLLFGRPRLAFHIDQSILLSPCMTADNQVFQAACLQCEQLESQTNLVPIKHQVAELMATWKEGYPTLREVAGSLACSDRTLMRWLKAEGSSYQALLDEARFQRALSYLTQSTLTIEEIASRLGFTDTTNFSRTFKRWSGQVPSTYRVVKTAA